MNEISDLQCGKAGEYLICADLIMKGYVAFPSEQGLPFDVVVDVDGKLIKIQVKSTRMIRSIPQRLKKSVGYLFSIKICGKNRKKTYAEMDVDIFALIALDKKEIGYLHKTEVKETMVFRKTEDMGKTENERRSLLVPDIKKDRTDGMMYSEMAKKYNLSESVLRFIVSGRYYKNGAQGRFLTQFTFENALKKMNP